MPRSVADVLITSLRDPRLAAHALGALPVWLWSADGARILFGNTVGAALFGRRPGADLAARSFGPADQHRRQVARLARQLNAGAVRLERLEGFGAPLGRLRTCACSPFAAADGTSGLMVAAVEPAGRTPSLVERIRWLLEGLQTPAAAFDGAGRLIDANAAAKLLAAPERSGEFDLALIGRDLVSAAALSEGLAAPISAAVGEIELLRLGQGSDTTLIALITPPPAAEAPAPAPAEMVPPVELVPPAEAAARAIAAVATPETIPAVPAEAPTQIVAPAAASEAERTPVRDEQPPAAEQQAEPQPSQDAVHAAAIALLHEGGFVDHTATARRHPLRFIWQMDAAGRFALGSDEFSRLIGPRTSTAFGRPWHEIADAFGLDPDGRVAAAIATRDTWSGITVSWPVDGPDARLPVELSGLPIYDRARQFVGYRGFGICRDLDALDHLAATRRRDALRPPAAAPVTDLPPPLTPDNAGAQAPASPSGEPAAPLPLATDAPVETPPNVVPFRPATDAKGELKAPTLTPVENHAFNELARQLASRLEAERIAPDRREVAEPPATEEALAAEPAAATEPEAPAASAPREEPAARSADGHAMPRGESRRDVLLYDRMPVGVLVYQLDRLLYANHAFLARVGYADLQALAAAGGLDALFVEPGAAGGGSATEEGTPVRIAATAGTAEPTDARLHGISWDGEAAHALIFSAPQAPAALPAPPPPAAPRAPDADASDLRAVFDAGDDAVLIFDRDGDIIRYNGSARRLFGAPDRDTTMGRVTDLFDEAAQGVLREQIDAVRQAPAATSQVRELTGLTHERRAIRLRLTMGRTDASGTRFFAICRELPAEREAPETVQRRQAERAASARADILTRISQDLRTPLNAIVGFTDVMIEERFGALGNERYAAYLKDIRASAERMLTTINDMVDLSRAETGQLNLSLAHQDLNETVEQCVAVLQPQANRERIIIRTALAQSLPPVTADAAALRQIVLNLVGNSIHVARAGGQIIVSTAVTDLGDIVLRVRDTGRGLNHAEMEAALEQFRNPSSDHVAQDNVGINMSLTRALVEANRAVFHVKSAPHSGTLIEVAFPPLARAG